MSRHEGVSCDSCLKGNFRGRRYKCLICYDYDLCATCYEAGAATTRHTAKHPIQCILTRTDFDLYYGGEALPAEQHQSFTCPQCGKMGYTELLLQEHVAAEHSNMCTEVVCPICAAVPGGDPNHVTDDFNTHLTMEHRTPREFDEPTGIRHVRRIPHPSRGVGSTRTRRANMHFPSGGSALTGLPPSGRETMDPIAELLSQLSSVRNRAAAAQSVSSQLQQLEIQLQNTRQQLERLPRRQAEVSKPTATTTGRGSVGDPVSGSNSHTSASNSQFLLSRCSDSPVSDSEQQVLDHERVDRSLFVQELILSTLTGQLQQHDELDLSSLSVEQTVTVPNPTGSTKDAKPAASTKKSAQPQSKSTRPKSVTNSSQPQPRATATVSHSGSTVRSMSNHVNSSPLPSFGSNSGQGAEPGSGLGPAATHSRPTAGSTRDARVNPSASKRTMLKHLESNKTAEKEPPPH